MSPFDSTVRGWVTDELGHDVTIAAVRRMRGGVSSLIDEITFTSPTNQDRRRAILRRVEIRPEEPQEAAGEIANETRVLSWLKGDAKSPLLLACDPDGSRCGLPATLQTRLPGQPVVAPTRITAKNDWWVHGLIEATLAVSAVGTSEDRLAGFGDFRPWWPESPEPPSWASSAHTWSEVAHRLRDNTPPGSAPRLVHRDLHPANVLFHRRRWSGIVDWTHGCVGPVEVDVSRCRVQIAFLADMDAADHYLAACREVVPTYDPDWDALVAIELSPWVEDIAEAYQGVGSDVTEQAIERTLDHFVHASGTR